MRKDLLYSISAIYDDPDKIIHATDEVAKAGYKKFDVHTPYPVHGLDSAMRLKHSMLGYFALVFGLTGTVIALGLIIFTMLIEYPMVIGGKAAFSLPAYIPVTFELTVLLAAVGTAVSMIVVFFKFPNNSHPLHDTDYMAKVSSDRYGITIEAKDANFDEKKTAEFLKELGAEEVQQIHYDEDEISFKHKILEPKFVVGLAIIALITSGSTYFGLNKLMFMTPFNWMMEQSKISAQDETDFFADGFSMREPVEGTVSRGEMPYPYIGEPEQAGRFLVNPLSYTPENIKNGEEKYDTFCSPCHGYHGEGESRMRGQFPIPPSLHSSKLLDEWSDGRIYHVITEGQNTMPGYKRQLNEKERWQVVAYVRTLQRALNAKEEDLQ